MKQSLLHAITAILLTISLTGCGDKQPIATFVTADDIEGVNLCHTLTIEDGLPVLIVTCLGKWRGEQVLDAKFAEYVFGLIVWMDGELVRLREANDMNKENQAKLK